MVLAFTKQHKTQYGNDTEGISTLTPQTHFDTIWLKGDKNRLICKRKNEKHNLF